MNECPGTCCRAAADHPFLTLENGFCEHYDAGLDPSTRKFGGCRAFDAGYREANMTLEQIEAWRKACFALPYVRLDVPLAEEDNEFLRREGESWCDCFRREALV